MAVVIETTLGDITVDLYLEQRPVTCLNFLKLCKMKYYNFNLFHTIRSGFIAQTGDPTGEGSGGESIFGLLEGPEKRFFSGEKMPKIRHTNTGLLSMVCTGDMMVGSQFFFTLGTDLDSLDGVHCVIGEVTEGHEVLRKLNEAICDETHRPYQDVRITHTVVLEDPFSDPSGLRAPSRSPSPCPERLKGGRIAPDEELDETQGKSAQEIQEIIEEKEAKARATILEIVGDLPDADIAPPENVLFVCKLNPVTTDEDLEIIFSRFGKIESCEVIRDKKTGDSLQYAFIEFADKKSCEDAYFKMDNVLIDDRRIHVDFSQSVSKMRWLGKGRGVQHFDDDEIKDNSFKQKATKPNNEQRSRKSNRDDDREKEKHKRHREEKNRDHERKNKGRENDRRDRSSSKEKYGDKYKRISKPDDVRREKMQRDRSKSIEKDNEVRKQKRDNDNEKRNRAEDGRREKNYRDRSRSIERHNEKRQQNQEKEYDKQNKAESRKEKNGRERERNHLDDDERKHDTDVIYERKSRTSAVRKEVYSSTNRSGYDRNTEHEKEYERRSNVNDSRRQKNFRERSNSVEINDKEIRQEYGRKIKADDGRRERSNSKERSKTSRQRSTGEVYRNREQKNSDYEHYDTGSKKNKQKESKRNKSDSHKSNNKSPSRNRDNSTDNDRASHRDRNDRIKEVESNEKSRERTEKDLSQTKGRKRQLEESKHTSNKKQKKSKREGGEPLTPSPTERKEKTKSKKSEKSKNNVKNEKNKKKKRKESTSSDSSTSESSSSSDSSSSSESDNKKKRLKRKRKYSSSSSSDSSDSSSSSSSSSDSSSDSSSSSSGSEKNKRRKKNVKRKVVKKIKKK